MLISNKFFSGKKTINTLLVTCMMFNPLHIMLPNSSTYVKRYDGQSKCIYFLIENDDLLEKYNTSWDKVSTDTKKYLITSTRQKKYENLNKTCNDEVTDFYVKEIPKVDSNRTC